MTSHEPILPTMPEIVYSYLYQYIVGGLIFFIGIYQSYIKKNISLKHKNERKIIIILIVGFVYYCLLHGLWILAVCRLSKSMK